MDISEALEHLVPAAKYGGSLTANTQAAYEALRWEDERPKPSFAKVQTALNDFGQQADAQAELFMLDGKISRLEEDLVTATGVQLWGEKATAIARKIQLRAILNGEPQ